MPRRTMPAQSVSPRSTAAAVLRAWSTVKCGGIISSAGSTSALITVGRSARSARSHTSVTWSGWSTSSPRSPSTSPQRWYAMSGSCWLSGNIGVPSSERCSQLTKARSRLLSTSTTNRGSAQPCQYFATVISSLTPFICIAPSPIRATSGRSGWANFAARAYGMAPPIDSRVPDRLASIPGRTLTCRAYQAVVVPQSTASITSSGRRSLRVAKSSCGLTGWAACSASSRCDCRHAAVAPATVSRQRVGPGPGPRAASSARRVGAASPVRFTSVG